MANEIQTITVPDFVGATGFPYIGITWTNYLSNNDGFGSGTGMSWEGLTAEQAADDFESTFNLSLGDAAVGTGNPADADRTISVTGALDGTSLVLTIEFDGPEIAGTNVDQGAAADWGDVGMPVVATVQDGGDEPALPSFPLIGPGLVY